MSAEIARNEFKKKIEGKNSINNWLHTDSNIGLMKI